MQYKTLTVALENHIATMLLSDDLQEAMQAIAAKREATFKN